MKENSITSNEYQHHIERLTCSLKSIINRSTKFPNERRLQINFGNIFILFFCQPKNLLGLLELVAELFILCLSVFDAIPEKDDSHIIEMHRNFLKCIANTLINLTFENLMGKSELCRNKNFMTSLSRSMNGATGIIAQVSFEVNDPNVDEFRYSLG
jgi:hypothetical protein